MWIRVLLSALLASLSVSCMKSFTTVSGSPVDTVGIQVLKIDTTRIGPEIFLKIYYREK
jgi:hypothetical protein